MTNQSTKIIIIEPSLIIQQGIKILLEENHEFEIVRMFPDLPSFEEEIEHPDFQIILINPAIISCYKQLSVKNLFSEYSNAIIVGIVYSYIDSKTINGLDGALDIYDDSATMIKKLSKIVEAMLQKKNNTEGAYISDREKEILISVAKGLTNKEIAQKHFISIHTVISHRKNISRKIGIKTVSGLTIYAIFNNLISEEDL